MNERKQYEYRILILGDQGAKGYLEMGIRSGRTPDEAIRSAGDLLPDNATVIAIPVRSWHERQIAKRMEPILELSDPKGS